MSMIDLVFEAKLESARKVVEKKGDPCGLDDDLVDWVVKNYGRERWHWCAQKMLGIGNAYTDMNMRMGEHGM